MFRHIYILVGTPASGKTWVSDQLKDKFEVIEHDYYKDKSAYINALINRSQTSIKPILGNTPFGLSEIMGAIQSAGIDATPVFIIERSDILEARYIKRDRKPIPKGHITRQLTYLERAAELGSYFGTSDQVLKHLKELKT